MRWFVAVVVALAVVALLFLVVFPRLDGVLNNPALG